MKKYSIRVINNHLKIRSVQYLPDFRICIARFIALEKQKINDTQHCSTFSTGLFNKLTALNKILDPGL